MRSLLVITNADAGTSDEERLAEALVVLHEKASVEVAKTSNPGELDGAAGLRFMGVLDAEHNYRPKIF